MSDDEFDFEGVPSTVVDRHDLSLWTGLTPKQIEHGLKEGMPALGERKRAKALRFDVPAVVQWLITRDADPLAAAKIRAATATATKREIEAAQLEGRMADIEEVTAINDARMAKVQSDLLAIPARLAVSPEIQKAVREEITAIINRLAAGAADVE